MSAGRFATAIRRPAQMLEPSPCSIFDQSRTTTKYKRPTLCWTPRLRCVLSALWLFSALGQLFKFCSGREEFYGSPFVHTQGRCNGCRRGSCCRRAGHTCYRAVQSEDHLAFGFVLPEKPVRDHFRRCPDAVAICLGHDRRQLSASG